MLLDASKWQGYNFYSFWVIKGKPTGWVKLFIYVLRSGYGNLVVEEL